MFIHFLIECHFLNFTKIFKKIDFKSFNLNDK